MAIENAFFGVWDLDPRCDMVHYSPQWKSRLGFPRVDAADSSAFWRCRVHPDDAGPMLGLLRSHLDGCTAGYDMRFRLRSNGSGYRTMLSRGRVVARDSRGNATRMIGTMVDLTSRPASRSHHGLPAEVPGPTGGFTRLPFHAVLGLARATPGIGDSASETWKRAETGMVQESHRLVALIDDLLDLALRDANAAG
ncbi:MAG: PAS domain-containing protein [Pseudomonadota bacterium]|nr:PAS domain-containing protein [Pseudomonadota bacterium]